MLVRFDFGQYVRRPVPECLWAVRERAMGVCRGRMMFYAVEDAHIECAPVVSTMGVEDAIAAGAFVADARLADAITRAPTDARLLAQYEASIRRIMGVGDLEGFDVRMKDDYEACRTDVWVAPYYPEVIVCRAAEV